MIHEMKTWPIPFRAIVSGLKRHEIRQSDRPFAVGDVLALLEWDPTDKKYTGQRWDVRVTYLTNAGEWGLPEDICIMSIRANQ